MMEWKERSVPDSLIFATPKNSFLLEDRVCAGCFVQGESCFFFPGIKRSLKITRGLGVGKVH